MIPEMNCAPKLAWNSSSFFACERGLDLALPAEHLHQLVAGERLLDLAVQLAGVLPLGDELLLRALGDRAGDQHRQRHRDQGDQGQQRRDPEHHRQHADDGQQRGEQLAQGLLQRLGDVVDVVGDPAQQLAARLPVEVGQRQPVELLLHLGAQPADGALDDAVQEVALQPAQQARGEVQHQGQQQHPVRAVKSMPGPGTTSIRASMSAKLSLPAARAAATACSAVVPAGSCRPTTPAKIRSVAWPRIFGPIDAERRR